MKENRGSLIILFATIAVVMVGFGIIIPVLPFLITSFGGSGTAIGPLISIYAVMQFIFAPIWGILSERIGRKPVLIIGIVGNGLSHLLFGLSDQIWMLFVARALAGILSSATLPTAMAYIGDRTSKDNRGGGMGQLSAAMMFGILAGPGLGGWLAGISLATPFFVASAASFAALLPVLILLPESLPRAARQVRPVGSIINQFSNMKKAIAGPLAFPLMLALLLDLGLMIFEGVFGLFALERYGFGPMDIGYVLIMNGILGIVMQGLLSGPLTRKWGEVKVIKVSLLFGSVGFVLMLATTTLTGIMLTVGFFIVAHALLRPSISAYISKRTTGTQGEAMGLSNAFMSLGRIIGPTLGGLLYDIDITYPYLGGAIILLIGFFACLKWLKDDS
jgi:DHA1 family multidrug resistance protein-like MFS transporter